MNWRAHCVPDRKTHMQEEVQLQGTPGTHCAMCSQHVPPGKSPGEGNGGERGHGGRVHLDGSELLIAGALT